jgi:hypothetical protein
VRWRTVRRRRTLNDHIAFRWRDWLWALRWRFPVWIVVAVCYATVGVSNDDGWLLVAGLLLVPALMVLSLVLQGVLAFL